MVYNYNIPNNIKTFINDKSLQKLDIETARELNNELLKKCTKCKLYLGKISIITYFLLKYLDIDNARYMNDSAGKQRKLICALQAKLLHYKMDEKYLKGLHKDLKGIHERCKYVFQICEENVKLTEHYPYFKEIGFDRLSKYALDVMKNKEKEELNFFAESLLKEIAEYKETHPEQVEAYILEITPRLERMKAEKERLKDLERAEKEAERAAKLLAKRNAKFIKKDIKEMEKSNRQLERSYRHLYDEAKKELVE